MIGLRSCRRWKSLAVILLLTYGIVFVSPHSLAFAQETEKKSEQQTTTQEQPQTKDDCMQGTIQGKADAKGNPLWILGGFLCGIFGFGAALFSKPGIPAEGIMGHSSEYVVCYTQAYQGKSRNKNVGYACLGWVIAIPVILAIQPSDE